MKNKIHYTRQSIMAHEGVGAMTESPHIMYGVIEFPENSQVAIALRRNHPRVMAFEEKYLSRGINWRAKLDGQA